LAFENLLEAAHRGGHRNLPAPPPGEPLPDAEWLAQEALNLAGTLDRQLVLGRQLVHAENRNDVLQVLESLKDLLHPARDVVMLLADDLGRQGTGGRGEGIDRGIDPQ